ncbi:hypothetical protein TELCIR_02631 [Teladorsagia circumcincta]|uniref:Uncharacterized protein n=1 Tax=Teladorsagia circumcincta TaxID=45464 RepID=A0A2G9UYM9_TELCI|nr:hypothetical protein TELCIR_02631 [Teladorsagia circumcincta]
MKTEFCRKDDVETWVYQQVEITVGRVPWKDLKDEKQVFEYKKKCRQPPALNELFASPCPKEYIDILQLVDSYKYYDQPDYHQIYSVRVYV